MLTFIWLLYLSNGRNRIKKDQTDLDGSLSFCSQEIPEYPIRADMDDKINYVHHYSLYNNYNVKYFRKRSMNTYMNKVNCLDKNMTWAFQHDTNYTNSDSLANNNKINNNNNNRYAEHTESSVKDNLEAIMKH